MEPVETARTNDALRMKLRGLILLSSEIIAPYWPMRRFVHHNPLHGLEDLHFEEAVYRGRQLLGGNGYLSNELFRGYYRSGRILPQHLDAALRTRAAGGYLTVGGREISQYNLLRAHLLYGISAPAQISSAAGLKALIDFRPDRSRIRDLTRHLTPALKPRSIRDRIAARGDETRADLARRLTLAAWCDGALGTQITDRINREMIKWCEAFLDEGHATWSMPGRESGFYRAWKALAGKEWSPCAIPEGRQKLARLPDAPDDALLECLDRLGIPSDAWQDYLMLELAALPGWAGVTKWRADQTEHEWQQAYPADLVQLLAVRLWYERELVQAACHDRLGIEGTFNAISDFMRLRPHAYFLRREQITGRLPAAIAEQADRIRDAAQSPVDPWEALADRYVAAFDPVQDEVTRCDAAWRLLALADALEIAPTALMETPPETLIGLLNWLDAFPESDHGPVWLKAFEAGYREALIEKLRPNLGRISSERDAEAPSALPSQGTGRALVIVRPQAQAVFCIDVRSEPLRRHFEAVSDYETFGFAGFFTVFIRYRALGSHHDTDQFPVVMKAKNAVREVPRTYHGQRMSRHRAGTQLLHAGDALLHDLKENVVTPYVAVESLGWFYSLPFVGKTLFTDGYHRLTAWLRRTFVPAVATSLTVDKLSRQEVAEMLAAEQRAVIRRALQERFGERDLNLSLARLEFLRRRALDEVGPERRTESGAALPAALSLDEETAFVENLRRRHRINPGGVFARVERITRTGFTPSEQLFTVETALRMMGMTRNFARLVLFCGHGSTTENNPFEAALDCGACGGNSGKPNARVLATMANKPQVREQLARNGVVVPQDTYFIAGQHDTTTDRIELFDLEDLPATHLNDLLRLNHDLDEAGRRTSRERCARLPDIGAVRSPAKAMREVRRRSGDWSQVRPEWGLSGNAAFIIGRRDLIRGVDLQGRAFLHSYDYREDPTGRLLEIVLTGPQVVGQWINMEHYFSTVDNEVYGCGSKVYHNVVGRFAVMSGPQSDLRTGLAQQTVMNGARPYHEPMRLFTLIEAPKNRIDQIIRRHRLLQRLYDNEWLQLTALDPEDRIFYSYVPKQGWTPENGRPKEELHR